MIKDSKITGVLSDLAKTEKLKEKLDSRKRATPEVEFGVNRIPYWGLRLEGGFRQRYQTERSPVPRRADQYFEPGARRGVDEYMKRLSTEAAKLSRHDPHNLNVTKSTVTLSWDSYYDDDDYCGHPRSVWRCESLSVQVNQEEDGEFTADGVSLTGSDTKSTRQKLTEMVARKYYKDFID